MQADGWPADNLPQSKLLILKLQHRFLPLEAVVVAGTQTERCLKYVPVSVPAIDRERLEQSGAVQGLTKRL